MRRRRPLSCALVPQRQPRQRPRPLCPSFISFPAPRRLLLARCRRIHALWQHRVARTPTPPCPLRRLSLFLRARDAAGSRRVQWREHFARGRVVVRWAHFWQWDQGRGSLARRRPHRGLLHAHECVFSPTSAVSQSPASVQDSGRSTAGCFKFNSRLCARWAGFSRTSPRVGNIVIVQGNTAMLFQLTCTRHARFCSGLKVAVRLPCGFFSLIEGFSMHMSAALSQPCICPCPCWR